MATRPPTLPRWATDVLALITEPSSGKKDIGWEAGERPPVHWWNWWKNLTYLWLQYLDLNGTKAWGRVSTDGLGAVTVNDHEGLVPGSCTVTATYIQITFVTALANTNYVPIVQSVDGSSNKEYRVDGLTLTTTTCRVHVQNSTSAAVIDPTENVCHFVIQILGHQ